MSEDRRGYRRKIPLFRNSTTSINDNLLSRFKDLNLNQILEKRGKRGASFPSSKGYKSVWRYWKHVTNMGVYLDPISIAKLFYERTSAEPEMKEKSKNHVIEFIADVSEYLSMQDVDTSTSLKTLASFYAGGFEQEYFNHIHVPSELLDMLKNEEDDVYMMVLSWCKDQILDKWGMGSQSDDVLDYISGRLGLIDETDIEFASYEDTKLIGDLILTIRIWSISLLEEIESRVVQRSPSDEIIIPGQIDEETFDVTYYLEDGQIDPISYNVLRTSLIRYSDFIEMNINPNDAYTTFMTDSLVTDNTGDSRSEIVENIYSTRRRDALGWMHLAGYTLEDIKQISDREKIPLGEDATNSIETISRKIRDGFGSTKNQDRQIAEYLLSKNDLNNIEPLGFFFVNQSEVDNTETSIVDVSLHQMTDFYFTSMKMVYDIETDVSINLFRETDTTIHVPFILIKDGKDTIMKVFSREGVSNYHNISHISTEIISDPDLHRNRNFISFAVWLREEFRSSRNVDLQEFNKSYTYVKMWPELGELEISVGSIYLETVLKRIREAFNITIKGIKWQSSLGNFYIVGSQFNNHAGFAECVRNNPVYHYYLSDSELDKIKANTSRSKMTFVQPSGNRYHAVESGIEPSDIIDRDIDRMVHVTVSSSALSKYETVMIHNKKWKVPENSNVIQLSISKISKDENLSSFRGVFSRLWKKWTSPDQGDQIVTGWWTSLFGRIPNISNPIIKNIKIPKTSTERKLHNTGTTLVVLQNISSKLFGGKYTTKCPKDKQPHVINDREYDLIKQEGIWNSSDGKPIKINPDNVMEFNIPGTRSTYNMICPNSKYPYPTLTVNEDFRSTNVYKCIPCCDSGKTDLVEARKFCSRENFDWIPGIPKAGNILYFGQRISSGEFIDTLLGLSNSTIVGVSYPEWYTRFIELNTMIHAVLEAVDNISYAKTRSAIREKYRNVQGKERYFAEELKRYAIEFRIALADTINPGVMKQEMSSYSNNEILNLVSSREELFDSSYLYRSLESLFGVNIFVLVYNEVTKIYEFEVPQSKLNHIRCRRDMMPSIVLVRHNVDGENSHYSYIECGDKNNGNALFGRKVTKTIYDNYSSINSVQTVTVDDANQSAYMYNNYYQSIDVFARFGGKKYVRGQFVDEYGHMTSLVVGLDGSLDLNDKKNVIIVSSPPSQPENIPIVDDFYNYAMSIIKKTPSQVASIIGLEPVAKTINGIWFSMEKSTNYIKHDLHVLCDVSQSTLPYGPPSPLQSIIDFESNNRLRMLRDIGKMVIGLIDHSYEIYARGNFDHNVQEFSRNYTVRDNQSGDSLKQYVPDSVENNIVFDVDETDVQKTISDAGNYVKGLVVTWGEEDQEKTERYRLYNNDFARKVEYHLKEKFGMVLEPSISKSIVMRHVEIRSRDSTVFESIDDYRVWLKNRVSYKSWMRKFDLRDSVPIPYNPENNVYYLIQPVDTKNEAIIVCLHWLYNKRNIGNETAKMLASTCQPVVDQIKLYSLEGGDLKLVQNSWNDDDKLNDSGIEILKSGERWAAMLSIHGLMN